MHPYYITSKAARELDATIKAALIVAFGFTSPADADALSHRVRFEIETDAGRLEGALYYCEPLNVANRKFSPGWVHFRFDDPAVADALIRGGSLNTYSGKWNFHFGTDPAGNVDFAARMVECIKHLNPRNITFR